MSGDVINFYDNTMRYVPPCCRPNGRCTNGGHTDEAPKYPLSEEDEHKLTELINRGASMREVINFWQEVKAAAHERKATK